MELKKIFRCIECETLAYEGARYNSEERCMEKCCSKCGSDNYDIVELKDIGEDEEIIDYEELIDYERV
jgi:predicted nucleic-acid-binding Zn-ribbon protein